MDSLIKPILIRLLCANSIAQIQEADCKTQRHTAINHH